jgi:GMP synthase (glutamine-hydrolysing)
MKILLIDNGTRHLGKLKDLLTGNEIDIHPLFQKYPPPENYDLIILSGGSQIAINSAPEVFKEEISLIKTSQTPIIGICEGCEIIAFAFGSKLEPGERKVKGVKIIKTVNKDLLNVDIPLKVYESHFWTIKDLGKDVVGIAKSQSGWEVLKHKTKPIYGMQFHPEMFVDKTFGDEVFRKILSLAL